MTGGGFSRGQTHRSPRSVQSLPLAVGQSRQRVVAHPNSTPSISRLARAHPRWRTQTNGDIKRVIHDRLGDCGRLCLTNDERRFERVVGGRTLIRTQSRTHLERTTGETHTLLPAGRDPPRDVRMLRTTYFRSGRLRIRHRETDDGAHTLSSTADPPHSPHPRPRGPEHANFCMLSACSRVIIVFATATARSRLGVDAPRAQLPQPASSPQPILRGSAF